MITDPRASFTERHFVMADAVGLTSGVVEISVRFSDIFRGAIQDNDLLEILSRIV